MLFLNSQPNENGISLAKKLFNRQLRINLPSVKPLLPQNSFITKTSTPRETTHSLPNIPQGNTVSIRNDEQNLWDKTSIAIKQNNRPRWYNVLNENGNVIIINLRHLIPTNEKFTQIYLLYQPPQNYRKVLHHRKLSICQNLQSHQ